LLTGASGAFVGLPRLAGFVDAAGTRLFASASLLGASGHGRVPIAGLASASVTIVLPRCVEVVHSSHVVAFGLGNGAGAAIAGHLSIFVTSASGAAVLLGEGLSDLVTVAVIKAVAGFVGAADLSVALARACVAVLGDGLADGERHSTVLAVAWHRVVRARELSAGHARACVALISVECRSDIDGSAVVLASAGVVGAFDLSRSLTSASVARILRGGSLGEGCSELHDSAVVVAVARVVGALHLSALGASAGIAILLSRLADSQFHALVLAFAWHRVVSAVNSVLGALTGVASISLVEGGADLYDSSHVVAGALSVVADDLGVGAALTFLASIQVRNIGVSDLVGPSVVVARALLGVASNHSGLRASAGVAAVGVDP